MRLNLLLASVAAVAMAAPLTTAAQTPQAAAPQQNQPVEVEIDQGVLRPLQIAVVPFAGTHGSDISSVVSANLRRSGFFEPLNPSSFIETGLTLANAPNFPQWTQIGAQAVLYGGVTTRGDGRLDVGFRLYDRTVSASWSAISSPPPRNSGAGSRTRFPTSSISG